MTDYYQTEPLAIFRIKVVVKSLSEFIALYSFDFVVIGHINCRDDDIMLGTVTSTVPRYGHLRSNGFDWLKVFLQKNRKKGTLITS